MQFYRISCAALAVSLIGAGSVGAETVNLVFSHPNMAPGEEVFMYAVPQALGYFADEGIEVNVQAASGGAQAAQVVLSGGGDLATTMAEGVLQLRGQGADLTAFLELKRYNGFSIGIPAGSDIHGLEGLVGRTIGFPVAGGGVQMIVDESFRMAGLEPNYTLVVTGAGAPAAAAINNGEVDALVLWDAAFGILENQGLSFDYIDLGVQNELAGMSLVARAGYLQEHRAQAVGYCRAMTRGLVYTLANPEAAIERMFEVFPQTLAADVEHGLAVQQQVNILNKWLDSALRNLPEGAPTGEIDPARWAVTGARYLAAGLLASSDTEGAFDTSFFEECNDFDREAVIAQAMAAQ